MTLDDAYGELGLPPTASLAQAKAAWRSLVSRWHPDRNSHASAVARMQRINLAMERIRGLADVDGAAEADPEQPAEAQPQAPTRTVERDVSLTLEEAAAGCIRVLRGTVTDPCAPCGGSGQALQAQPCAACEGQGEVRERTWFGWLGQAQTCEACAGRGRLRPRCGHCDGKGKTEAARYRMSVRLPAGVRSGDVLHVPPGRGAAGVALDLRVTLRPHEVFVCDEDGTLRCELPVDGFAWIANHTVQVPTLQGPQALPLRRGQVQYRLPGLGFPHRDGRPRPDQVVMLVPHFPAEVSTRQQRLLDQLAGGRQAGSGA